MRCVLDHTAMTLTRSDCTGRRVATPAWIIGLLSVLISFLPAEPVTASQERSRPIHIGALTDGWGPTWEVVGLRDGLTELGYRENDDFMIGVRFTQGDSMALTAAARDLLEYGADILFTGGRSTTQAAYSVTRQVPIVFAGGGDPVRLGLIQSFAFPNGNVTGITELDLELAPKRLEFFKNIIPGLKRVLFVYNAGDPYGLEEVRAYREAAMRLELALIDKPAHDESDVSAILAELETGAFDGILSTRPVALNIPESVLNAGKRHRIPTMFASPFFVENGGLASYSPHSYESGRMAARLIAKIIEGQSPSAIPVEANQRIELLINLKTANLLGMKIPPEILFKANRIIR